MARLKFILKYFLKIVQPLQNVTLAVGTKEKFDELNK